MALVLRRLPRGVEEAVARAIASLRSPPRLAQHGAAALRLEASRCADATTWMALRNNVWTSLGSRTQVLAGSMSTMSIVLRATQLGVMSAAPVTQGWGST